MVFSTRSQGAGAVVGRLVINADGHVDVTGNLDVGAGLDVTGNLSVAQNIVHTGNTVTKIEFATNTITFDTDSNERLRINSSGYVGVGEDSPATILHVKANLGDMLRLDRNNTGAVGNQISFRHSNSGTLTETGGVNCVSTANADTGQLRFSTKESGGSVTEKVRITSTGRIQQSNNNEDIDMDSSANGQLRLDGNGYNAAIALNATGMNIYHNHASKSIIFRH